MPFAIDMVGVNKRITGKLLIDRSNIIFTFPYNSDAEWRNADRIRSELEMLIRSHGVGSTFFTLMKSENDMFAGTDDDPRHDALAHISQYDRYDMHVHFPLKENVSFPSIKYLFRILEAPVFDPIMSPEWRSFCLNAISGYFAELDTTVGQNIEAEYKAQKDYEIKAAENTVATSKQLDVSDDSNSYDADDLSFTAPYTLIVLSPSQLTSLLLLMNSQRDFFFSADNLSTTNMQRMLVANSPATMITATASREIASSSQHARLQQNPALPATTNSSSSLSLSRNPHTLSYPKALAKPEGKPKKRRCPCPIL